MYGVLNKGRDSKKFTDSLDTLVLMLVLYLESERLRGHTGGAFDNRGLNVPLLIFCIHILVSRRRLLSAVLHYQWPWEGLFEILWWSSAVCSFPLFALFSFWWYCKKMKHVRGGVNRSGISMENGSVRVHITCTAAWPNATWRTQRADWYSRTCPTL